MFHASLFLCPCIRISKWMVGAASYRLLLKFPYHKNYMAEFPKKGYYRSMKNGFTLIEIIVVLSVLGILAALYTASTGNLSDVSIDTASRRLQSDLRYVQQLATNSGVNHGVVFTSGSGYTAYRGSPGTPVIDPVTRQSLTVSMATYQGVALNTTDRVEFDPTGTPVMGGDHRIRMTATSGSIRDIYVVDKTGAVVIDLIEYGTGCACNIYAEERK